MAVDEETAALVALLRSGGRAWSAYVLAARQAGGAEAASPQVVLEQQLGLLAYEAVETALADIGEWHARGWLVVTMRDPAYPENLRFVEGRPPLLFAVGELSSAADARSIAIIGTRNPSPEGRTLTRRLAESAGLAGYTIVSGLAAGVDSEAHKQALADRHRTVAVIGTGVDRSYPPENESLQREVAERGAVLSQFWPGSEPARTSFPMRNAVMSGLTLGTVIVEAGELSGTRTQARHALAQGRTLILMEPVLVNEWARELAKQPGALVATTPEQALMALPR